VSPGVSQLGLSSTVRPGPLGQPDLIVSFDRQVSGCFRHPDSAPKALDPHGHPVSVLVVHGHERLQTAPWSYPTVRRRTRNMGYLNSVRD
jgi:hypothetical protein